MLERKDVLTDDLMMAPKVLTKDFQGLYNVLVEISKVSRGISLPGGGPAGSGPANSGGHQGSGGDGSSTKKQKEETEALIRQQKELAKVQQQIANLTARDTEEYRKQAKELANLKQQLKEKTALGDRDATTLNKQNASLNELRAALNANRASYAKLVTEEQRASKQGTELLGIIQQQDEAVKELSGATGDHTDKVGDYAGQMKKLKAELKLTKDELVAIGNELGADSEEFAKAAEKAGKLQDEINDVNDAVKQVSGSKLENLGSTLGQVGTKLKNLDFKGAAESARSLVLQTKALTFKDAISGAGDFGKTMLSLGKALLLNPIFLITATVIGIGAAVIALKDKVPFLTAVFDKLGKGIDFVVQKGKEFSDWALGSEFLAADRAEAQVQASKKEIEAINERYDFEIAKAEAAGQETIEIEKRKQAAIKREAKKALDELNKLENRTPEQLAQIKEFVKIIEGGRQEEQIGEIKHQTELQKIRDAAAKEREKKENDEWEKRRKKLEDEAKAFKFGYAKIREGILEENKKLGDEIDKGIKGRFEAALKKIATVTKPILETVRDRWIGTLQDIQKALNTFGNAVGDLFASITARRIAGINEQQKKSEESTRKQLKDEKDRLAKQLENDTLTAEQRDQLKVESDKRQRAIEEAQEKRQIQFEERRRRALRKQAIYEKALALAKAVVSGALGTLTALAETGIPGAIAAAALAAIQVAAIATTPIPAAEKGIKNHKGGLIIAGEKGEELVKTPDGKMSLTDPTATLYNFPKGTEIIPHDQTMRMLALNSLSRTSPEHRMDSYDYGRLERGLGRINKTIMGKPSVIVEGRVTGQMTNSTRIKYIESLRNRGA